MAQVKLSIIILNYRSAGLVKQCLRGVFKYISDLDIEVIVVDNNSQDKIKDVLKDFPQVQLISNSVNNGFAAGNNKALQQARGEFILILNPDIAILENSVQKMIDFLQNKTHAGMVVPKLLNPDRSIQYSAMRFPTILMPLYRRTFLGKYGYFKKKLDWYLMKKWDHQTSRQIEWALGACMLVKRSALNHVGLFDERYFLYVEDTDWCRRFWENKWEIWYVAEAPLIHYHMRESAANLFSRLNLIHIFSWLKYFWKFRNYPKPNIS